MSFVSGAYLLFLPLVTVLYHCCPGKMRPLLLLAASYVFYMGWNAPLALVLLGETALCYAACLLVEKRKSRVLLATLLCLLFAPLFLCKYLGFIVRSITGWFGWPGTDVAWLSAMILPVGISFYTFQAVSCVIDVYRDQQKPERSFLNVALYLSFFPQLVAGPIERASDLLPQLTAERRFCADDLLAGSRLLLCGFLRKICLADLLAPFVDTLFAPEQPDGLAALLGGILFGLQIYNDFAGYSEIAQGSARLMGIRLTRNFREPYLARGIRDFWRRWHITLNRWFQLYVYQPLGGKHRRILAATAVFLLSGLWHGAAWTFLLWGAVHALLYGMETLAGRKMKKTLPAFAAVPMTFLVVSLSWLLFRASTPEHAGRMALAILSPWDPGAAWQQSGLTLPVLACLAMLLPVSFLVGRWAHEKETGASIRDLTITVLLVLLIAFFWLMNLQDGTPNAFIYFQF